MSSAQPATTAILGAGFISQFHIQALRQLGIPIAAVCDQDRDKARSLAQRYSIPDVYDSLEAMLDRCPCDVVHVVLPPAAHAPATIQCLHAGRDVLVEKPFAVSVSEGQQVEAVALAAGRTVGINHNHCYHPASLQLEEYIRTWRLGTVEHMITWFNLPLRQLSAGQHGNWMFRQPINIVLEQGVHPLSHIIQVLGPVRAAQTLGTHETPLNTGKTFIGTWHCALECERGTAQLLMSFGKACLDLQTHVIGEDGVCSLDLARNFCRLSQKTRFVKQVDDVIASWHDGSSVMSQGFRGLSDYALAFLKLRPPRSAFFSSILESIRAFYQDRAASRPLRQGIPQGLATIDACERIEQARVRSLAADQERVHG